ncbi:hypothetical protein ACJMK2_039599 [Sinanodonta woodiana]|uniref:Uncharacterized protein n=1 Tax=Sinanodonta woodiana TaxID=1069815 RepID=A0ABD3WEH0_SINWO
MLPVLKLCVFLFLLLKGVNLVELSYITDYEPFNLTFPADENFKPTALTAFSNGKQCDALFASDLQYYSITISNCQGDKILIYLVDTILKKGVCSMLSVHERKKSDLDWFINKFLRRKRQSLPEDSPEINKTQQIIGGRKSGATGVEVVETTAMFNVQFNDLDELTYFCDMVNDVLMALNPDVMVYKSVSAYNSATKKSCPATLSQNSVIVSIFNCSLKAGFYHSEYLYIFMFQHVFVFQFHGFVICCSVEVIILLVV